MNCLCSLGWERSHFQARSWDTQTLDPEVTGQCHQTPLPNLPWSVAAITFLTIQFDCWAWCEVTVALCDINWAGQSWVQKVII